MEDTSTLFWLLTVALVLLAVVLFAAGRFLRIWACQAGQGYGLGAANVPGLLREVPWPMVWLGGGILFLAGGLSLVLCVGTQRWCLLCALLLVAGGLGEFLGKSAFHRVFAQDIASSIRFAVLFAYDKHLKLAVEGSVPQEVRDEDPAHLALFSALGTRLLSHKGLVLPADHVALWAELAPFLHLEQEVAREAIAEYVIYKELPRVAKCAWLKTVLQRGCELGEHKEGFQDMIHIACGNGAAWVKLLGLSRGQQQ